MTMVDLGLGCRRLLSQYSYYNNLNSKRNVLTQLGTKHALYKTLKIAYDGPDAFKIGYNVSYFLVYCILLLYYYLHTSYFWIEGLHEAPVTLFISIILLHLIQYFPDWSRMYVAHFFLRCSRIVINNDYQWFHILFMMMITPFVALNFVLFTYLFSIMC